MRTFLRFIQGFIIGATLGALIALLLAPASGEELRQRFQSEIQRLRTEIKQAAEDRRAELEQQLAALRSVRRPET